MPAYVEIADRLRRMIVNGRLAVDRQLPSETDLATRYGVSRSTVREALRQLTPEGLVVTTRGVRGGSRVAKIEHRDVGRMLDAGIALLSRHELVTVRELLETREYLEVPGARLAARHRTPQQLEVLTRSSAALRPTLGAKEIFAANRAFHAAVLDASGNRILNLVSEPLFNVLQTRLLRDRATPSFWRKVAAGHREILDAIARSDPEAAGRAMARHLLELRGTYERIDVASRRPGSRSRTSDGARVRRRRAVAGAR